MSDSADESHAKEPDSQQRRAEEARPAALTAGDFYYERGLVVFTAAYHLKRGYCCNSGCRHCPFR